MFGIPFLSESPLLTIKASSSKHPKLSKTLAKNAHFPTLSSSGKLAPQLSQTILKTVWTLLYLPTPPLHSTLSQPQFVFPLVLLRLTLSILVLLRQCTSVSLSATASNQSLNFPAQRKHLATKEWKQHTHIQPLSHSQSQVTFSQVSECGRPLTHSPTLYKKLQKLAVHTGGLGEVMPEKRLKKGMIHLPRWSPVNHWAPCLQRSSLPQRTESWWTWGQQNHYQLSIHFNDGCKT